MLRKTGKALGMFLGCAAVVSACLTIPNLVDRQKRAARQSRCIGHATRILVSLGQYQDKYGHLPPAVVFDKAGKPMHSWRVLLLEFIDSDLFKAYDFEEPWNGPNNKKFSVGMPECYSCPNDPEARKRHLTSYVGVTGERTAFPSGKRVSLEKLLESEPRAPMFAEVTGSNIHWMEPRDICLTNANYVLKGVRVSRICSLDPGGPVLCNVRGDRKRLRTVSVDRPEADFE